MCMKQDIFLRLMWNINRIRKLPIEVYSWRLEMKVLEMNIEISDVIEKYEKMKKADYLKKFENKIE
jgi:hypothetical protein